MKRTTWLLLAFVLTACGCLNLPFTHEEPPKKETRPKEPAAPPPPVVTPEEVTEANAEAKAKALKAELDYDGGQSATSAMGEK